MDIDWTVALLGFLFGAFVSLVVPRVIVIGKHNVSGMPPKGRP